MQNSPGLPHESSISPLTSFVLFNHCPFLLPHGEDVQKVLDQWKEYKMGVPTYGAIILDETLENVLLVQGYLAKSGWGFPKGKVNKEEAPHDCAVREVSLVKRLFENFHFVSWALSLNLFLLFKYYLKSVVLTG
ncbi:DCP2 hydrolase, partial [Polyodon spathula]|nr:DCP2 hydrolase [Polyodon spathula]